MLPGRFWHEGQDDIYELRSRSRLDLTVASCSHDEPQWNPILEEQVLNCVHRINQTKPMTQSIYH